MLEASEKRVIPLELRIQDRSIAEFEIRLERKIESKSIPNNREAAQGSADPIPDEPSKAVV